MLLIKVKFLKNGKLIGREYTYWSKEAVKPGDMVAIGSATASVTQINVPEEEIAAFKDKVKIVDGKVKENND